MSVYQPRDSAAGTCRLSLLAFFTAVALAAMPAQTVLAVFGSASSSPAQETRSSPLPEATSGLNNQQRTSDPTPEETQLFRLVNRDRELSGLSTLVFDTETLALARERADAQRYQPRLTHRDESGQLNFAAGLAARGVPFHIAAENLARVPPDGRSAAEAAASALMSSEHHRAIILHTAFDRVAVGSSLDASGQTVFAQLFRAVNPPPGT